MATKFEEAKKLMELLGIPFQETMWSVVNNVNINQSIGVGQAMTAATTTWPMSVGVITAGNGIPYYQGAQGTAAYCYNCNSYSCYCYTKAPQNAAAYCYGCYSQSCTCHTQYAAGQYAQFQGGCNIAGGTY